MVQVDAVLLGDGRGRMDHALRSDLVFLAGDLAGQFQQQAVAHRDVRDDHLPGPRLAQQGLVDQQGRIEGFGLGEGQAVAFRQFLGGVPLAAVDQLVEAAAGRSSARSAESVGVPTSRAAKRASPPTATNESIVAQRHDAVQRRQSVFEMCCRSRPADRCGDSSLVENISCSRIEPSRRLCEVAISPLSSRVSRVLPPPTSAIRAAAG